MGVLDTDKGLLRTNGDPLKKKKVRLVLFVVEEAGEGKMEKKRTQLES